MVSGPEDYQRFVCAEIPDPIKDPKTHKLVLKHMIHGPCKGTVAEGPPCMKNGQCTKNFPKPFAKHYAHGKGGDTIYQRLSPEDGGQEVKIKCKFLNYEQVTVNNSHVVPYNKVLLRKYDWHICVEIVNTIMAIKYGIKYVTKGSDKVIVSFS